MVKVPVLFTTYTRVHTAKQVWDAIKKAQPQVLYFYSNKAPLDKPDQIAKNEEIRSWINEIDWECDLHTFFRVEPVDVYTSTRGATDWLFENEEWGIILEDDTVPSQALFTFHEQMLKKFKDEKRVWYIGGTNLYPEYNPNGTDYIFSRMRCGTQAWATWRDRWKSQNLDINVKMMIEKGIYKTFFFGSKKAGQLFDETHPNMAEFVSSTHIWDFVLYLNEMANDGLHIIPSKNLMTNIGDVGAHFKAADKRTMFKPYYEAETYEILNEPLFIYEDVDYDEYFFKRYYSEYLTLRYKVRQVLRTIVIKIIGENRYKKIRGI
jgi:hypothetical protein